MGAALVIDSFSGLHVGVVDGSPGDVQRSARTDMAGIDLTDKKAVAKYLTVVLEENDPAAFAHALGTVARARGMAEIAKASGIGREASYKALRLDTQPRFETITRVCAALDLKLTLQPVQSQ